jgi:WD40 repeat protein
MSAKSTSTKATLTSVATTSIDDFPADMTWSPDSSALVVGGGEGRLYRVNRDGGAAILLGEHAPGVLNMTWQPKGQQLATSGQDGSIRLWQMDAAAPLAATTLHRAARWPAGLAFRPDGQALAFASGKELLILDAQGQVLQTLAGHSCPLSHLAWRGRDEIIAVGNGALFVDRIDSGKLTQFVLEGTPLTLALSPDMKIVANGLADGSINFRYLNNQKRSRMSGYDGKVDQTAWSANSRYLATSSTGASSVVVWDFGSKGPEGSDPLQLTAHEERIESLAWQSGGSMLASAGRDWRVVLWRPGPASHKALDIQLLDGPAGSMCWSPDGKLLAVAQPSGKLRLFALKTD